MKNYTDILLYMIWNIGACLSIFPISHKLFEFLAANRSNSWLEKFSIKT